MRLWSFHPHYLDARGLVTLWREALLAQAVLRGTTRGYTRHPQLHRFNESTAPQNAIAAYLQAVAAEALARGYRFDTGKIVLPGASEVLPVSSGQLQYEWMHLRAKLAVRNPAWLEQLASVAAPEPHPLFVVVPGAIAAWERAAPRR